MSNSTIDKLERKQRQLAARLDAARRREATKKRRDDDTRKATAGRLCQHHCEMNPDSDFTRTLLQQIAAEVKHPEARTAFGLDPLPGYRGKVPDDQQPPEGSASERTMRRKRNSWVQIIAGAVAMKYAAEKPDSDFAATLHRILNRSIDDKRRRALFGLPELAPAPANDPPLRERFSDRTAQKT